MESFYIYLHKTVDTLEPYYVGKGKDNRAWGFKGRSQFWQRVSSRHGCVVEIVASGLREDEAFKKEKELIAYYGRRDKGEGSLVNLTDGGEGVCGLIFTTDHRNKIREYFKGESHPNYKKDIFTFYNYEQDTEVKTTRFLFKQEYQGADISAMYKGISSKGWVILDFVDEAKLEAIISGFSGKFNHHADQTIHKIINLENQEMFSGTRIEIREKWPKLNINGLLTGTQRASQGWTTIENFNTHPVELLVNPRGGERNTNFDHTEYEFINLKTRKTFIGTRNSFEKSFGFRVYQLFTTDPDLTVRDWCLKNNAESALKNTARDYSIYTFKHDTGETFTGTQVEFKKAYPGVRPSRVISKELPRTKGWSLAPKETEEFS